jgi:hypothetical protein
MPLHKLVVHQHCHSSSPTISICFAWDATISVYAQVGQMFLPMSTIPARLARLVFYPRMQFEFNLALDVRAELGGMELKEL